MYGVSILLEKLGCRWFTSDISRIPRQEALWLPELNEVHSPAFEYREVFFTEAQGREWSARNRLNGHFHRLDESVGGKVTYMPFAHSYYDLVPPSRHFASHPEYFALVDGKRRGERAQLCLTNAEVGRLAVEQASQWLTEHPEVSIVSVSQNDGGGWCECDPCRKAIAEEGGAISGLALRLANRVAARLALTHPGRTVDMLAYQDTADPPSTARPLPNVQIRFCPIDACQAHSYRTCLYNRTFRDRLERWSRTAPKLCVWQYSVNFSHYLAPFPNYDQLIADIPAYARAGVSGLFVEGAVSDGGGGDDAELRSYLAARLLWRPDLDAEKEIREFLDAVYGPAARLMWQYFVLRRQEVRRGQHLWIDQNMDAGYLTRDFLKHGRALLGRAAQKARTGARRRRIERELLAIEYVEAIRERRCVVQGGSYGPADPARVRLDTRKLLKRAEDLGVTNLREGYPIAQQARDWGDPGSGYAAVLLTDGATGATVVPGLEGRVVAFGRRNVLRVPDPGEPAYPRAGGILVRLADGYATPSRGIAWQVVSAARETVALTGRSDLGRALQMQIAIAEGGLRVGVTVSNLADSPARTTMMWRAEFACGPCGQAEVGYRDRSGRERNRKMRPGETADGGIVLVEDDVPQQGWTLTSDDPSLRLAQRFHREEVARCGFTWSFRGAKGLSVVVRVWSPEVELAPGQQLTLTSEYDLEPLPFQR
jgi:hypothetical protein